MKFIVALALTALFEVAFAHGGNTDGAGCHHEKKTGGYHCH
jgi:hypothetical protein